MEILAGNLYDIQAEVYNDLSGSYDPEDLLQECDGDIEEAARQIVDGAICAGMIAVTDVIWDAPDGIRREMDCYGLVEDYLERVA